MNQIRKKNNILNLITLCFFGLFLPQQITAQQNSVRIAAVVNEDIISLFDVQSRIQLFLATSGIEDTVEIRQRLLPQVMSALIEEKLKLQEARREELKTTEDEILNAVKLIEQNNNMQSGAFISLLKDKGIDPGTFYKQVEADVVWLRVAREVLSREITVSEDEVNTIIERLTLNQGKPEYLVSELFLPIGMGVKTNDVYVFSQRLAEQARNGNPFQGLAQQFSQSATAAIGGDLGWVHFGELEVEIDRAITAMNPGEFSEPIRTISGYTIVHLREKRTTAEVSPYMAAITLSQIYLATAGPNKLAQDRLDQLSLAIEQQVISCPQMNDWAKEIGAPGSGPIDMIRIGALPEKIRDSIVSLPPGQVSPAIEMTGARLYLMICQRQEDDGLPSANQVYSQLESQKLDIISRQRLRDLRREALIDIRL
ncbi:MAG: hypothetical protein CMM25_04250 [Rhodospirillaceae bacterium]|nr:hypothetical protein [Rhodospirillaceae bacterium]